MLLFKKKKILGHNSTFCNRKMQMLKKLYIFKHFAKSKNLFFLPISIILCVIPIQFETLKAPNVYCLTCKWAGQLTCPDERGAGPGGVSRGVGGRRAPVGGLAAHAAAGGRGTRARRTAARTVRPGSIALPNSKRTGLKGLFIIIIGGMSFEERTKWRQKCMKEFKVQQ
jgi:hypothetical protein